MDVMGTKSNNELIEIIMDCELDMDYRKHAAMEVIKRLGVSAPWVVKTVIL
ncbi:hypothetical protein OHJ21_19360 [Virgibacillus sp. LDC1]|uniref:hypothetical protein n=1 Tax=Paenibacillus sp. BR1-192 TaxID=3032287 RepID=UPI00240D29AA|nr:hypothetical protein [Paenibacillus sp. BR1-192]MCV4233345.1 hypothetical protein [Virgibacillus sp. LDC1]WFB57503.1 hypothetical protein P0X86_26595 [Paenibacillus sp. BR1-192]